jgi:hypothetical protein
LLFEIKKWNAPNKSIEELDFVYTTLEIGLKEGDMEFFDLFENITINELFGGGTGETIEKAVVINTITPLIGVAAEYQYVSNVCGEIGVDWNLKLQNIIEEKNRYYDVLQVELNSGESRSFYFDITQFYS